MHMRILLAAATLAFLTSVSAARAQTVILVQGYLGDAYSFRANGINVGLHRMGWRDGGHMTMTPRGVMRTGSAIRAKKRFYTVELPTEAPLIIQANLLVHYVAEARRQSPDEPVVLVGHSAGGVVSRLMMALNPRSPVKALVTIASPHLGAAIADAGSSMSNSPLSWFAPFFGGATINRSRALYHDLGREGPHNILGWLNRQPHPKAEYVSVIRADSPMVARGDSVVAGWRQDMNMTPALRGRAKTLVSPGKHFLRPDDAMLIAQILARLKLGAAPPR